MRSAGGERLHMALLFQPGRTAAGSIAVASVVNVGAKTIGTGAAYRCIPRTG